MLANNLMRKWCTKSLEISKGQPETVNRRRTVNAMAKRKKGQTNHHASLHI